jgi:hypothetical protein
LDGAARFPLLALAVALFVRARNGRAPPGSQGGIRMSGLRRWKWSLDLDTGAMNGLVLAGSVTKARNLTLDEADLMHLHSELAADPRASALLEAYLDRRSPDWRAGFDMDDDAGLGAAPSSGAMTQKEAYEVLGLAPGASEAEIREAHRRLMKRMHPDAGGTAFLAGRINAAKDVLLRRHD